MLDEIGADPEEKGDAAVPAFPEQRQLDLAVFGPDPHPLPALAAGVDLLHGPGELRLHRYGEAQALVRRGVHPLAAAGDPPVTESDQGADGPVHRPDEG